MGLKIEVAASDRIGFVSQQNSVPPLREITLVNTGEEDHWDLRLELNCDPAFLHARDWHIDRLAAGQSLHLLDRDIEIAAGQARSLTEAIHGTVRLKLCDSAGEPLATTSVPMTLLAVDDWGGADAMPELLPSFVAPNDPAVAKVLRAASQALASSGREDGLDGYESGDKARVYEMVSAIWSAVSGLSLTYALPPASFETNGQKIRSPSTIYSGRVATCLDTALLFAAAIEQAGLHPLVVLTQGHAFAGAWMERNQFADLVTEEVGAVRNRLDLGSLVLFETTMVTGTKRSRFSEACQESKRQLEAIGPGDLFIAIDVHRARMRKILPLAATKTLEEDTDESVTASSVEGAPDLYQGSIETAEIEEGGAATGNRIDEWQRKLLDLTARNRLLNLPSAGNLDVICPDPARLEDILAEGQKVTIQPLPDLGVGGRDEDLYRSRSRSDLRSEHALAGLSRNEVFVDSDKAKLEASLVKLYRQARSDLNEGGSNTLFLAFGFLEWKKKETDEKAYRAPLILQPVRLERRNARAGMKLVAHEDEPRFNMTLLELLRQDFGLVVSGLDGELPKDESGIDVKGVWNRIRHAITGSTGFEVREKVVLGIFSFSKYLMWKDLVDRRDLLTENAVVRHLVERGREPFPGKGPLPEPLRLDKDVNPADLFAPLPADSSQLAAVIASGQGHDFVLDGPPGTGKSQTIANMIAQNLALGRRVLFVSEKRAALDVVYRRLDHVGLGDFCLELHSHKSAKIEVLRQLERAWNAKGALAPGEWAARTDELRSLRNELNGLVAALHERHSCGLTVYDAIWRVVRDDDGAVPSFSWEPGTAHSAAELEEMRRTTRSLELTFVGLRTVPARVINIVNADTWSNAWQARLITTARELREATLELQEGATQVEKFSRFGIGAEGAADARRLDQLGRAVCQTAGLDLAFAFRPDHTGTIDAMREEASAIREWHTRAAALSTVYSDPKGAERLLPVISRDWKIAQEKIWPLNLLAMRGCTRRLADAGGSQARPDLDIDLPLLSEMADLRAKAERLASEIDWVPASKGLASDPDRLGKLADASERIRSAVRQASADASNLAELLPKVRTAVVDANEMAAPDAPLGLAAAKLTSALMRFENALSAFAEASAAKEVPDTFAALVELCDDLDANRSGLNALCQWNSACLRAEAIGLGELARCVEAGLPRDTAVPLFETAYAKWFAPWAIDQDARLACFHSLTHEDRIRRFGELTDEIQRMTAGIIRARLCSGLPDQTEVSRASGYGILKHELAKQRAHKPVRKLAEEMGKDFSALAPCMLMSPLSIAQYLPPDQDLFDIVIFDEASQITPWDAVGSIARGRQLVLAGDQKQMPPTNFFSRGSAAADEDTIEDLESILDECVSASIPRRSLDWHYRSRHDSLIAFSNSRYYEGKLVTFPAPETRDTAVEWHRVEGVYAKGAGQTNAFEAQAIVAEARRRLSGRKPGDVSLGIVTLNTKQQELIEDLLEKARKTDAAFDEHFSDDLEEPVFVKNLETVQGDERDIIILGTTFGPTEAGARKMSMNFGPLNKDGGWRRLNVAVTRARKAMLLFTSFDSGMVDLSRTSSQAIRDLKHFVEFADRGPKALAEAHVDSVGGTESPFEDAVKAMLEARGWQIRPQIGVSGYRIDLGVVHPDQDGNFLAGIECDGAMYHSALTARDRDKVRQAVLEDLGWRILRIWSTDFWIDAARAIDDVDRKLREALAQEREEAAAPRSEPREGVTDIEISSPEAHEDDQHMIGVKTIEDNSDRGSGGASLAEVEQSGQEFVSVAQMTYSGARQAATPYRRVDLTAMRDRVDPAAFGERSYDEVLETLVKLTVEAEAPIRDDHLATVIARAHGFARTGRVIRERVDKIARQSYPHLEDEQGLTFVWKDERQHSGMATFRVPEGERMDRSLDQIAIPELRAAASSIGHADDKAVAVARLFNVSRLRTDARQRIEIALSKPLETSVAH